jgi:ribosomal protein S3
MGQKVNPVGLRLGINRTWDSRWYDDRGYARLLAEDLKLRAFIEKRLASAGISRIVIERPAKRARITIHTARPGVVIGKKGQEIEVLRKDACGGRLGGAEIARSEWYREGRVPLHTLRANVDFARATAHTPYGTCGVKVWVFRGEIMEHDPMAYDRRQAEIGPSHGRDRDRDHGRGGDRS